MCSNIPLSNMSHLHRWEILRNVDRVRIRKAPSYESGIYGTVNSGRAAIGYLYHPNNLSTEQLERCIRTGEYVQRHFFVILEDRDSCIAVIGKEGDHILQFHAVQIRGATPVPVVEYTQPEPTKSRLDNVISVLSFFSGSRSTSSNGNSGISESRRAALEEELYKIEHNDAYASRYVDAYASTLSQKFC